MIINRLTILFLPMAKTLIFETQRFPLGLSFCIFLKLNTNSSFLINKYNNHHFFLTCMSLVRFCFQFVNCYRPFKIRCELPIIFMFYPPWNVVGVEVIVPHLVFPALNVILGFCCCIEPDSGIKLEYHSALLHLHLLYQRKSKKSFKQGVTREIKA